MGNGVEKNARDMEAEKRREGDTGRHVLFENVSVMPNILYGKFREKRKRRMLACTFIGMYAFIYLLILDELLRMKWSS